MGYRQRLESMSFLQCVFDGSFNINSTKGAGPGYQNKTDSERKYHANNETVHVPVL